MSLAPSAVDAWPPWSGWVALLGAFALAIAGGLVVALVGSAFGAPLDDPTPAVNIAATVVQDGAFIGVALLFAQRSGRAWAEQLGLRRTRLRAALGRMALVLVAFYVFTWLWAALVHIDERDQLPQDLGVHESTVALVAVCVVVTVLAPVAEELLFRGYFFAALRNWRGPWPAAALTGIVFGLVHAGSASVELLAPLAFLGFLLCLLRWWTGSLLPCMALHAVNNSIAFAVNEADWSAGATLLLILGANAAILLGSVPFVQRRSAARALD